MTDRSDRSPDPVFLLTDFGVQDPYVGLMKAVLMREEPRPRVIDLTHDVTPQDETEAAFLLEYVVRDLPESSVLLLVVDPEVGTERSIAAIRLEDGPLVVAPDRGLVDHLPWQAARLVENEALFRETGVSTFHGRDRFAPVGRFLALGGDLRTLGPEHPGPGTGLLPTPEEVDGELRGEVVYVDRFGNLVTNLPSERLASSSRVLVEGEELPVVSAYGEGEGAVALVGSYRRLEVAWVGGSARERLELGKGATVVVQPGEQP